MAAAPKPVTKKRIKIAKDFGIDNADIAAEVCRKVGIPFFVALALLEKESGGRNVYGHDVGGALAGFEDPVDETNFRVFWWLVTTDRYASNGVGPCQITYRGYFDQMHARGLEPWDPRDNMIMGFQILKDHYDDTGAWSKAGARYNGGPTPNAKAVSYGRSLAQKINVWKKRLEIL